MTWDAPRDCHGEPAVHDARRRRRAVSCRRPCRDRLRRPDRSCLEPFRTVVYGRFLPRELTRDTVRAESPWAAADQREYYKALTTLFTLPPADDKRLLAVLHYTTAIPGRRRSAPRPAMPFASRRLHNEKRSKRRPVRVAKWTLDFLGSHRLGPEPLAQRCPMVRNGCANLVE